MTTTHAHTPACLGWTGRVDQLATVDTAGRRVIWPGRYRVRFGLDRAVVDFDLTVEPTFL